MSQVKIFTMDDCPYCMRAKQLLTQRGVPFEEVHVDVDDDSQWDALFKLSGMKTMPQIFFGEKLIGGYRELAELDHKNGLRALISE